MDQYSLGMGYTLWEALNTVGVTQWETEEVCRGHSVGDSGSVQGSLSGRQWKCAGVTQWETAREWGHSVGDVGRVWGHSVGHIKSMWGHSVEGIGRVQGSLSVTETWNECGVSQWVTSEEFGTRLKK